MTLRVENEIVLGRAGNGTSRLRDFVDLDKFRASELGVSRRHAVICRQDGELYIRDLNSTNHTFVNGMRVPEDRDFLLQAGDEIALGKLILKVYFG
ncbi:MAG: FHA domain-containing protein [Anaerolineae bacterium]|nr:FHA domain-containing protein [Anaerolineae bacterium]